MEFRPCPEIYPLCPGRDLLVVVGILIALQVNNWNQSRLERKEERKMLAGLHEEFIRIEREVLAIRDFFETGLSACMELSHMCDVEDPSPDPLIVDSLLNQSFNHYDISISQPIFESLVTSDRLPKLSNTELKDEVYSWKQDMDRIVQISHLLSEWTREEVTTFLTKNASYKNLDVVIGSEGFTERSRLLRDYDHLFRSLEFENLIQNKIFFLRQAIDQLNTLQSTSTVIQEMTKGYMD